MICLLLWFLSNEPFLDQICDTILWFQIELDRCLEHLILDKASLLEFINQVGSC